MKQFLHNPWAILGLYWAFSAFVSGMPTPDGTSGKGYIWAYRSLNMFAANVSTAAAQVKNGATPLSIATNSQTMAMGAGSQSTSDSTKATANPYSDLGR